MFELSFLRIMDTSAQAHTLHIKNMVCNRCIIVVRASLERLGLHPQSVGLGEAILRETITQAVRRQVRAAIGPFGFELLDDKREQLIEQIKNTIVDVVHHHDEALKTNLSDYLQDKLHRNYGSLSKLFSEVTNTTIEKYLIAQKIERAKELLVYGELTINEIADKLNYSSTAYFSSQFKSVTGLTPSHFKAIKEHRRKPLDEV